MTDYFQSLSSAEEYLSLLEQSLEENLAALDADIRAGNQHDKATQGRMIIAYTLRSARPDLARLRKKLERVGKVVCR